MEHLENLAGIFHKGIFGTSSGSCFVHYFNTRIFAQRAWLDSSQNFPLLKDT